MRKYVWSLFSSSMDVYVRHRILKMLNFVQAASSWLYVVPWGIRKVLNYIAERYDNPPVYITENGNAFCFSRFLLVSLFEIRRSSNLSNFRQRLLYIYVYVLLDPVNITII